MNHELYVAFAGLKSRAQALEVVANNLSNAHVAGFKRDNVYYNIFNRIREKTGDVMERSLADSLVAEKTVTDFAPGSLTHTANPLHLALAGDGFFAVETARGVRYTRDGSFTLDDAGRIVTADGSPVLGEQGPLVLPPGNIQVAPDGQVSVDGVISGKLKVVQFERLEALRKEGHTLFEAPEGLQEIPPRTLDVRQGFLEESNLNPVAAVSEMMALMRSFEMLSRAIRSISSSVDGKVIDEVGRI